jgi:hypothetical protein
MSLRACFYLLFVLIFINFNCKSGSGPSRDRPAPVRLIASVNDTCRVEAGMDAVPEGDAIHIEWTDTGDDLTAGFEVNRAVGLLGSYSKVVTLMDPGQHSYDDAVPEVNVRYYYTVTAVDGEGGRSDPSDTLSYRLILKAEDLNPRGVSGGVPDFSWRDDNLPHANDYIVRVRDKATGAVAWIAMVQAAFAEARQSVAYNADGKASPQRLTAGRTYEWRVDVIGNESRCGSESPWVTILIQ